MVIRKSTHSSNKKPSFCAPNIDNPYVNSCLDKESLLKIGNSWNNSIDRKNTNEPKINTSNSLSVPELWNSINQVMKSRCDKEYC